MNVNAANDKEVRIMLGEKSLLLDDEDRVGCSSSSSPADDGAAAQGRRPPRVSVVIPALNEARNLPHVFATLPPDIYEIVLVDGRSTDETVEVARELYPDVRIVGQKGKGKGDALACGFAAA